MDCARDSTILRICFLLERSGCVRREEFRRHKAAKPEFLVQFFSEWESYVSTLQAQQSAGKDSIGQDLPSRDVAKLTDEQRVRERLGVYVCFALTRTLVFLGELAPNQKSRHSLRTFADLATVFYVAGSTGRPASRNRESF